VGVEIDILADEMRALADASKRRRENLLTLLLQQVRYSPPAPAAMPSAVHEHESLALHGLRRGRSGAKRRRAGAGTGACEHGAAGAWKVVDRGHLLPPRERHRLILAPSR